MADISSKNRVDRLFAVQDGVQYDALLITKLENIYYLSNFTGSTALLYLTPNRRFFVTDSRYIEQVSLELFPGFELYDNTNLDFSAAIKDLMEKTHPKRLGFESPHLPYDLYVKLNEARPGVELVATKELVEDLREVKNPDEVERIRKAIRINEQAVSQLVEKIDESMTEADLAREYEYLIRKNGGKRNSFSPIIASGPRSSKPHAGFTDELPVPGTPITFDVGVFVDGYCSDMTRTYFYKDVSKEFEKIYNLVRESQQAGIDSIRAGITGQDGDKAARDVIEKAGYGDYFRHGTGHGIGIEVHEKPRLSKIFSGILKAGTPVTVEPGIYLPGKGGVRIEDIVLIKEDGAENLNQLSRELRVIG